jgi:LuxR family maltose regulon positive regulatory protein
MEGKEHGIILLNKLQLPEIKTKTLRRRRLLNFIAKNLDKKVILLCAGAGYGKTTLLSHLLSEKRIRIVYYHLERKDAEPVVFFSYLIAGIRRINPSFGHKLEGLRHLFNHPQRYLEIIAGTFLNEVVENIRDDIYIILEDYHALHPSVSIDKMLDYVFNSSPV